MDESGCSSALPRPDPICPSSQHPNGDTGPSVPATPSIIAYPAAMDLSANQDSNDDLKARVNLLETQCFRLTQKLNKAKTNSQNVAQLVTLYQEKTDELDRTKTEFKELIEATQENFQRELERLTELLRETEKARSSADLHISEQSVLVSQLQSQLREVNGQRALLVDPGEVKKEMGKLRAEIESKDRQLEKRDEKANMQKLEIANLTQRVKSLERSLKTAQAQIGNVAQSAPGTPVFSNEQSSMGIEGTTHGPIAGSATAPSTPVIATAAAPKRTRAAPRSRAGARVTPVPRTGVDLEEDQEMADLFMEMYNQDLETQEAGGDTGSPIEAQDPSARLNGTQKRLRKPKGAPKSTPEQDHEEEEAWLPNIPSRSPRAPLSPSPSSNSRTPISTRSSRNAATPHLHTPSVGSAPVATTSESSSSLIAPSATPGPSHSHGAVSRVTPSSPPITPLSRNTETNLAVPSDRVLMPPPSSSSSVGSWAPQTPSAGNSARIPIAQSTSQTSGAASPSTSHSGTQQRNRRKSSSSNSMDVDSPVDVGRTSSMQYELQQVHLAWRPIRKLAPVCDALYTFLDERSHNLNSKSSDVLFSNTLDESTKAQCTELAANLCSTRPSVLSRAIINSVHRCFKPICSQWEKHSLPEARMVSILKDGSPFESLLVSFILTCAHGSFVASAPRIIESVLNSLHTHIHTGVLQNQKQTHAEMSDFEASAFVRLHILLCREYGMLSRARTLIFDIVRSKEEICMAQLLGGICAWPMVVESLSPSRSFVSCSIEAILSAALISGAESSDPLLQLQKETLQAVTGWKMESKKQLLPRWSNVLLSAVSAFFTHPPTDSATSRALGLDLVHSLELIGTQLGWKYCLQHIWQPLIWPSLAALTSQFSSEDLSQSASQLGNLSTKATTLVKATVAISRIGVEAGQFSLADAVAPLLSILLPNTPFTFSVQLQTVQAIADLLISQKTSKPSAEFAAINGWYNRLPPLQRRYIPPRLETLLQI